VQEEEAVTITIEEPVTLTFALRYADSSKRHPLVRIRRASRAAAVARLVHAS
jgi:hypothetical protein